MGASGQFGKSLVAASWKGVAYMRRYVIPANPQTAMQSAVRAAMRLLGASWAPMSAADKALWEAEVDGPATGLNMWTKASLPSMRDNKGPLRLPTGGIATAPAAPAAPAATAGVRQVTLTWTPSVTAGAFATAIYRKVGAGVTALVSEIRRWELHAVATWIDRDVVVGTLYSYEICEFAETGTKGTPSAEVTATPT
jgi:hypothetical protein